MLPHQTRQVLQRRAANGYNRTSIVFHWMTVLAVISLFFTHEAPIDSAGMAFHIGGGAIIGLFLIWRVVRRVIRGFAKPAEQARGYNIAARIVAWAFLSSLVLVVITGYLLPWSHGHAIDIYGFEIPAPMPFPPVAQTVFSAIHNVCGHLFLPLLLIHVLAVMKHAIIDKDDIAGRMFIAQKEGR